MNHAFFTNEQHHAKGGILKRMADSLNMIERMFNFMQGENGIYVRKNQNGFPAFGYNARGAGITAFTGTAYFEGQYKTTGLTSDPTKPWVKLVISTHTFTEEVGPPADPFAAGTHWWEKANTFGDIHYWQTAGAGGFPFVGATILFPDYTPSSPNIPAGWELWSLQAGRVVVGVGHYTGGGLGITYAMGDTGGFVWHGETVESVNGNTKPNNHPKHDLKHTHTLPYLCIFPLQTGITAYASEGLFSGAPFSTTSLVWGGSSTLPDGEVPLRDDSTYTDMAHHKGPFNSGYTDTDNRQPFIVSAWIRYTGA